MTAIAPVRYIRSWKEHYKRGMPLIFLRPTRLDAERVMEAGTLVSPELRAELGEHRMKMWWTARRLGSPKSAVGVPVPVPHSQSTSDTTAHRKEDRPKGKKT